MLSFLVDLINSGTPALLLLVLAAYVAYWYLTMPSGVPPGPLGLPLLGYLPFLTRHPSDRLTKMSAKYGGIMSMYLGNRFVVVLNSATALREAFVKQGETFSGRPKDLNMSVSTQNADKLSIIMQDGQFFKDHRRFALQNLRDCGFGKSSLEPLILDEIQHFLSALKTQKGAPYDLRDVLTLSVANNITLMVLGRRFDYDDQWLIDFKHNTDTIVKHNNAVGAVIFFPWLRHIPGLLYLLGEQHVVKADKDLTKLLSDLVKEHRKSNKTTDRLNYFNAYTAEQKERKLKNPKDETFSDEVLITNMKLFLEAGSETTSTTLTWFLNYMMCYPEVQARVQRELDDVIGRDRTPSCQDQAMTPYLLAVLAEVQRISTLVPLSVPHRNKEECVIQGYRIPKDTFILANLWSVHNNESEFDHPTQFRPERFINKQGQFVKPENMVAFSLGKRQCLGEPLARMELYLYAASMMQTFDFKPPAGSTPSFEANIAVTYAPKTFVTRALLRH